MNMNESPIGAAAEYAGCTRQNLQKLIRQGRISSRKLKNGRVMVDMDSLEEFYQSRPSGMEKLRTGESFADSEGKTNGDSSGKLTSLTKVELALKLAKVEDQRLKNEIRKKELINRSDIGESAFNFFRPIRDGLQGEPDRIAAKIRAADSDHEATVILKEANHKILESAINNFSSNDEELKKNLTEVLINMLSPL